MARHAQGQVRTPMSDLLEALFGDAFGNHPRRAGLWVCLAVILFVASGQALAKSALPQGKDSRYADALALFQAGKSDAAIYKLQTIVSDSPDDADVYKKLAEMAVENKNWAYAIQTLAEVARIRPEDVVVRRVLMSIFAAYQMPVEELQVGREVLAREPRNKEVLTRLAYVCHDQSLFDDETMLRSRLAELEPGNYENLRALALLHCRSNRPDEEISVLRRILKQWPDKREHRIRLAAVYGSVNDRFSQLEVVRALPDAHHDPVARSMKKEAVKTLRKEQKVWPVTEPIIRIERERYREFSLDRSFSESLTMFPSLTKNRDRGVWSHYDHVTYRGLNELSGKANIDTYELQARQIQWWDQERSRLTVGLGLAHVGVSSLFAPRFDPDLSPIDFPFLEKTPFGGTTPTGSVRFERRLRSRLTGSTWLLREVMPDIDALVRMVCRNSVGAAATYLWPDQTTMHLQYELSDITDNNTYQNAQFSVERVLWGTGPEHNYAGHRMGFFSSPPTSHLSFKYQCDYMDHSSPSRLYQIYRDEVQNEFSLIGELKVGQRMFLKAEGLYAKGNRVLLNKSTGRYGIGYRDPEDGNEIILQYGLTRDSVAETSQINQTLTGDSRLEEYQLMGRWHF